MDHPPNGGFFIMIIWKQNRIIPESLRSIIFRRIEKEHNDKENFILLTILQPFLI